MREDIQLQDFDKVGRNQVHEGYSDQELVFK